MEHSNKTGKPWNELTDIKDRQEIAKIEGNLMKDRYSGLKGVVNTGVDASKIYGRTLDNVGRNYTGPLLYKAMNGFGKFLYNASDPRRVQNHTTTWDMEKQRKDFEKQVQERNQRGVDSRADEFVRDLLPNHPEEALLQTNNFSEGPATRIRNEIARDYPEAYQKVKGQLKQFPQKPYIPPESVILQQNFNWGNLWPH